MDIARPKPEEQVSPAPWYPPSHESSLGTIVQSELAQQPTATPDEVVDRLAKQGIHVPGTFVATYMAKQRAVRPQVS